jgi:hypothetical protein
MIISPYAEKGAVRGQVPEEIYDHCSILKFLCDWLKIPPFTARIRSRHVRSVADLLTDEKRESPPPKSPLLSIGEPGPWTYDLKLDVSPIPVPPEELALQPHDLASTVENLRLELQREYPDEYARHFPELVNVPPFSKVAPNSVEP